MISCSVYLPMITLVTIALRIYIIQPIVDFLLTLRYSFMIFQTMSYFMRYYSFHQSFVNIILLEFHMECIRLVKKRKDRMPQL